MNELVNTDLLNNKEYLTIEEMEKTLKCSEDTVYRYVNLGYFTPVKFRQRNYFRSSEVMEHLNKVFNTETVSE